MLSLPAKTRRELLGILAGAAAGGVLGFALTFLDLPLPKFFAVALAVIGAILVGGYLRGEVGWMAYGAVFGAVLADLLWSQPKFNQAGVGILPGALIGLIAGVVRDCCCREASQPPLPAEDRTSPRP